MYQNFEENKQFMDRELQADASFDIVSREILIGEKRAVFYFINGFCDEDFMQQICHKKRQN